MKSYWATWCNPSDLHFTGLMALEEVAQMRSALGETANRPCVPFVRPASGQEIANHQSQETSRQVCDERARIFGKWGFDPLGRPLDRRDGQETIRLRELAIEEINGRFTQLGLTQFTGLELLSQHWVPEHNPKPSIADATGTLSAPQRVHNVERGLSQGGVSMPEGICRKCGERRELVLAGVCGICNDSLDKQCEGSTATDWLCTHLRNWGSGVMESIYRNTTYAQVKTTHWVSYGVESQSQAMDYEEIEFQAGVFWRYRKPTQEEIAIPKSQWGTSRGIMIRPATNEEVASYVQDKREWSIAYYTGRLIWETFERLGANVGEQEEARRVQAAEEIAGRLRELGWIEELVRMRRDDSDAYSSIDDARLLDMVLPRQSEGLTDTIKPGSSGKQPNSGRGLSQVAGMTDLKEQLMHEVIGPFKDPELYRRYRVNLPNGILFFGPPGCGKTYIARRLAEELGWQFHYCRPSDVASPYIHDTVSRIRAVFSTAIEKAPAIVFIDEFEAFVPARSELGGHQQYKAEEVNEFLANLEGCAERKVLVIAATNEPEKIDPAVRRSGRFDKLILIPPPDALARHAMLEFHLHDRPVETSLDIDGIAAALEGYSASDIKLVADEAARIALKRKELIRTGTLLAALERVPASITAEDVQRYEGFRSRGTG
jgi:transitional endoplasmic reticulum ATPase